MAWDFSTEPELQQELDWTRQLVKEETRPIDLAFHGEHAIHDLTHPVHRDHEPSPGPFPSEHLPDRVAAARERLAHLLEPEVGNL